MESNLQNKPPPCKATRRMTPLYDELAEAHNRITSANNAQVSSKLTVSDPCEDLKAVEVLRPMKPRAGPRPLPDFKFPMTKECAFPPTSMALPGEKEQELQNPYCQIPPLYVKEPTFSSSRTGDSWPTVEEFEKEHQNSQLQKKDTLESLDIQTPRGVTSDGVALHIDTSYGKLKGSGATYDRRTTGNMMGQQLQSAGRNATNQKPCRSQPFSGTAFGDRAQGVSPAHRWSPSEESHVQLSSKPTVRQEAQHIPVSYGTYLSSQPVSTKRSNYMIFAEQVAETYGGSHRGQAERYIQHIADNYGISPTPQYSQQAISSSRGATIAQDSHTHLRTTAPVPNSGDLSQDNTLTLFPRDPVFDAYYGNPYEVLRPDISLQPSRAQGSHYLNADFDGQSQPAQHQSSSVAEGSTVENIVKQYATDEFHDVDLESEYGWPSDTDDEGPFALKAPGSDVMESLRLRENPTARELNYVSVNTNPPPVEEPPPVAPPGSSVYGYRSRQSLNRQSSNPWASAMEGKQSAAKNPKFNTKRALEQEHRKVEQQRDLERVVSEGLRHQATSDSEMTFADFLRSDRATPGLQSSRYSVDMPSKPHTKTRVGAQSKLDFYDSTAIPTIWKDVDRVRIPVKQEKLDQDPGMTVKDTEQKSDRDIIIDDTGDDDDGWETVIGSKMGSRMPSRATGKGVHFQKTGSSLADNSSRGNISPVPVQLQHFSSTDKIIAHPAAMDGVHDLRARNDSVAPSQVFMPAYKNRSTNGLFQNSSRFPPTPYQSAYHSSPYHQPKSISGPHENPFLSSPPSLFSPLALDGEDDNSTPTRVSGRKGKGVDRTIHSGYDRLRDPVKPKTAHLIRRVHDVVEEGPSQWVRVSINGGLSQQTVRRDRTPLNRQPLSFEMVDMTELKQKASAAVLLPLPIRRAPKRKTLCQRIRSQLSYIKPVHSVFKTPPRQITSRPLCLREGPIPETPYMSDETPPKSFTKQNEFEFRSPLAPVRRESWQALYTKDQLATFRERARSDGVDDLEARWGPPARGGSWRNKRGTYSGRAMRTVNHAPNIVHLDCRPDKNVEKMESTISAVCLALCSLFPPFLLFFHMGYFDGIMAWKTHGQTLAMKKHHKRMALWLAPVLTISIVVVIVAIIVGVHFGSRA